MKSGKYCPVALAVALALHVTAWRGGRGRRRARRTGRHSPSHPHAGPRSGNPGRGGDCAPARTHQRHREPAEGHPRRACLWSGRRLEPAGDPRPRRRSPAHAGRWCRRRGCLPQPHEPAVVLHRSHRRRRHRRLRRRYSGECRWRQHRRLHPGALGRPVVCRARHDARAGWCRVVLSQQRQRLGRQPVGDLRHGRTEPRLHRLIRAVGQLQVRQRLQGLHLHRTSGAYVADRRGRLDVLRVEQPGRAARVAQRCPPARLHLQLPGHSAGGLSQPAHGHDREHREPLQPRLHGPARLGHAAGTRLIIRTHSTRWTSATTSGSGTAPASRPPDPAATRP